MGWIGAHATHGISETHVLHHVSSKIPHYNAYALHILISYLALNIYLSWEASTALKKMLEKRGLMRLEGNPGGWAEVYRVYKECKVGCVSCFSYTV